VKGTAIPSSSPSASLEPTPSNPGSSIGNPSGRLPSATLSDVVGHDPSQGTIGKMWTIIWLTKGHPPAIPSSSSTSDAQAPAGLSTGAKVVLILGIAAITAVVIAGLLYRHRRRKRRAALFGTKWAQQGSRQDGEYGRGEKGGRGLLSEVQDGIPQEPEKSQPNRLDFGSIGLGLASVRDKLGRRPSNDPYTVLRDEAPSDSPKRQPTRRVGTGIRLVGPRPPPSSRKALDINSDQRDPMHPIIGMSQPGRTHMLQDEDSRSFAHRKEPEDWTVSRAANRSRWTSASSILGDEEGEDDPFGDHANHALVPPIRGGPVPTPRDSGSDLDPFDDYNRRSSTLFSTYDDLLSPPLDGRSDGHSLPRSQNSGNTLASWDAEEGTVHHAQLLSHTSAAVIIPARSGSTNIKRSESFFKRMTQGGITSLLNRQQSQRSAERRPDIRDPKPAPPLWPMDSQDTALSPFEPQERSFPPSAFNSGLEPLQAPRSARLKGPSLSSLQSAKSMRDMIIVQREPTSTTEGEFVEIALSSEEPGSSGIGYELGQDTADTASVNSELDAGVPQKTTIFQDGIQPSGSTPTPQRASVLIEVGVLQTPARPLSMPPSPAESFPISLGQDGSRHVSTPPKLRPIPQKEVVTSTSLNVSPLATPGKDTSEPPSGSPVPSPLLSHRRPVRDVVNSINKRGSGIPLVPPSPSKVKASSGVSTGSSVSAKSTKRPATMYEAVKREPLVVANPDKRGELNRSNSD
jgi:hypothetical protein